MRNFGGDHQNRGITLKLNFSRFSGFDKQKVYKAIGVMDPEESKSGLIF